MIKKKIIIKKITYFIKIYYFEINLAKHSEFLSSILIIQFEKLRKNYKYYLLNICNIQLILLPFPIKVLYLFLFFKQNSINLN